MRNPWLFWGAVLGGLAVVLGAFGAHGLEGTLKESNRLDQWHTAVLYHLVHALAIVMVGLAAERGSTRACTIAGICFVLGTLLFSGMLYAWCLTGSKPLVMIVPIGGTLFILGWVALAVAGIRSGRTE